MADGGGGSGSPLKWIGIGCGIAALLFACVVGGCLTVCGGAVGAGLAAMEKPVQETRSFFTELRAGGDEAAAYARLTETAKAQVPPETFHALITGVPELAQSTDVTINQRSMNNGEAIMGGFLTTPSGLVQFEVKLVQSGEDWAISGVAVNGAPLIVTDGVIDPTAPDDEVESPPQPPPMPPPPIAPSGAAPAPTPP